MQNFNYISEVYNQDYKLITKKFEDKHFDIAIVDPPYGLNAPNMRMGTFEKKGHESHAEKLRKGRLNQGSGKLKNRALNTMPISWDYETPGPDYFEELFRISKHQIIFGGNYFDLPPTRCIICWDKMQSWNNFSQWEMAWTSFDKPARMYRVSNTGGNNKETKIHPTQKPVALYDKIYKEFTTPGMKIIDTHLGSGSNRISAFKHCCHFTGCEIQQLYYNDEQQRFADFTSKYKPELLLNKQTILELV